MAAVLEWAATAAWWEVLAVGIALNGATTGVSIGLWHVLVARRGVGAVVRRPARREVLLATSTTAVNAAALVPAWWLWREGAFTVRDEVDLRSVAELVVLVAGVDTAMYWLHRLFHHDLAYRWAHAVHHGGDERMSSLTLFAMHPAEAAGFSVVLIALMALVPVSLVAVGAFFVVNLWVGTTAHVPLRAGHVETAWDRAVGGSALHQAHHARERTSYGFFTGFWDRVAGTRATGAA